MGNLLGQLWSPFGTAFHYIFYLPIFNILMLLYAGVHAIAPWSPAFGIAIILLTIVVRLALFPLTRKQLQSSRAMQALAPQVQELQRRYKNNPQELMAAQQALYREHGVSMYGGCLPLVIQMPFLYGLFYSLYTALLPPKGANGAINHSAAAMAQQINDSIYPFLPHVSVATLPDTGFLWTNLAAHDPFYILPILAGVMTFLQLRMAQPVKAPTPAGQRANSTTQAMGSMQFVMPFITFFMALNFPSGLALYWTVSTAFSAVQQYFLTGWGSLFVGIPGLEHLVPEPQAVPSLPAARPASSSAIVDAQPSPERSSPFGGLRGLLRQLTEARPPAEGESDANETHTTGGKTSANGNGTAVRKPVTTESANGTNGSAQPSTVGGSGGGSRRTRAGRAGPMLVKPSPSAAAPTPAESAQHDEADVVNADAVDMDDVSEETEVSGPIAVGSTPGAPARQPEPSSERTSSTEASSANSTQNAPRPSSNTGSRSTGGSRSSNARRRQSGKSKGGR